MSSINFSVKIGNISSDARGLTTFKIDAQMHKQKIEQFNKEMQKKLSRQTLPTIFFQLPSKIVKEHIPIVKDINQNHPKMKYSAVQSGDKTFHLLDAINSQEVMNLIKKIQKVFSELTSLDNNFYLHGFIYGVEDLQARLREYKDYPICALLANCYIKGKFDLDSKFYDLFCELAQKISPKFANSPVMGLIPLFQDFDFELQFESIAKLNEQNLRQFTVFGQYRYPQNMSDPEMIRQFINSLEEMNVYIWLGKLGYLKISIQMRLIAHWMCIR